MSSSAAIHKHPLYYAVRNHIIDFLVPRSLDFDRTGHDPRHVPVVRPGAAEPAVAGHPPPSKGRSRPSFDRLKSTVNRRGEQFIA